MRDQNGVGIGQVGNRDRCLGQPWRANELHRARTLPHYGINQVRPPLKSQADAGMAQPLQSIIPIERIPCRNGLGGRQGYSGTPTNKPGNHTPTIYEEFDRPSSSDSGFVRISAFSMMVRRARIVRADGRTCRQQTETKTKRAQSHYSAFTF
jgi:hypothetical protein